MNRFMMAIGELLTNVMQGNCPNTRQPCEADCPLKAMFDGLGLEAPGDEETLVIRFVPVGNIVPIGNPVIRVQDENPTGEGVKSPFIGWPGHPFGQIMGALPGTNPLESILGTSIGGAHKPMALGCHPIRLACHSRNPSSPQEN